MEAVSCWRWWLSGYVSSAISLLSICPQVLLGTIEASIWRWGAGTIAPTNLEKSKTLNKINTIESKVGTEKRTYRLRKHSTVGIWNLDVSGFQMVESRSVYKWHSKTDHRCLRCCFWQPFCICHLKSWLFCSPLEFTIWNPEFLAAILNLPFENWTFLSDFKW